MSWVRSRCSLRLPLRIQGAAPCYRPVLSGPAPDDSGGVSHPHDLHLSRPALEAGTCLPVRSQSSRHPIPFQQRQPHAASPNFVVSQFPPLCHRRSTHSSGRRLTPNGAIVLGIYRSSECLTCRPPLITLLRLWIRPRLANPVAGLHLGIILSTNPGTTLGRGRASSTRCETLYRTCCRTHAYSWLVMPALQNHASSRFRTGR
jgi:hypothetical protein